MVHGTVPWVWITMMPGERAGEVPGRVSPAPVVDLLVMRTGQVVCNLLVFAAPAPVPRILAFGAGCSVLVETAQYVLRLERVSSVDDVLVNADGAVPAALASRRWWRATAGAPSDGPRTAPVPVG